MLQVVGYVAIVGMLLLLFAALVVAVGDLLQEWAREWGCSRREAVSRIYWRCWSWLVAGTVVATVAVVGVTAWSLASALWPALF